MHIKFNGILQLYIKRSNQACTRASWGFGAMLLNIETNRAVLIIALKNSS